MGSSTKQSVYPTPLLWTYLDLKELCRNVMWTFVARGHRPGPMQRRGGQLCVCMDTHNRWSVRANRSCYSVANYSPVQWEITWKWRIFIVTSPQPGDLADSELYFLLVLAGHHSADFSAGLSICISRGLTFHLPEIYRDNTSFSQSQTACFMGQPSPFM